MSKTLEARLEAIVRSAPPLMRVLGDRPRSGPAGLDYLFRGGLPAGADQLTGRGPDYGIKDYDLGYYEASDISYEAEDAVIRRVAAAFAPPLREMVEVRNQARVTVVRGQVRRALCAADAHAGCAPPLRQPTVRGGRAAGAGRAADDPRALRLDDLFALRLRPNPHRVTQRLRPHRRLGHARWPELIVSN